MAADPVDEAKDRVRTAIESELAYRRWNIRDLAREAEVDAGTIGDFLNGSRWPQRSTRSKLSEGLGWPPNGVDEIWLSPGDDWRASLELWRSGLPIGVSIVERTNESDVLLSMPPDALEGLSPAEREEVITAAKLSALAKAREIRRRLDE